MAVPGYETFMLPLLRLAAGGETNIHDCAEKIAEELHISAEDRGHILPSGRQTRFNNRVHWAKSYLVQAGLLEMTRRGHFRATPRGFDVLRSNPAAIDNEFLWQFPEFREFKTRRKDTDSASAPLKEITVATPEEAIDAAYEDVTDTLRASLLDRIVQSSPEFFEKIIVDLLLAMGYGGSRAGAGRRLGQSGDGGVDGVINEDPLGLDLVYIQAKRYAAANTVGEEHIRGFSGSLLRRGASKGVFVTTSRFSDSAREFARGINQQRIVLIDGEELSELLIKHNVGVRTERTIELKKLDLDYFEDEST